MTDRGQIIREFLKLHGLRCVHLYLCWSAEVWSEKNLEAVFVSKDLSIQKINGSLSDIYKPIVRLLGINFKLHESETRNVLKYTVHWFLFHARLSVRQSMITSPKTSLMRTERRKWILHQGKETYKSDKSCNFINKENGRFVVILWNRWQQMEVCYSYRRLFVKYHIPQHHWRSATVFSNDYSMFLVEHRNGSRKHDEDPLYCPDHQVP